MSLYHVLCANLPPNPLPQPFPKPLSLQSKPLMELQMDRDATGSRVLTCVYFPQRDSEQTHSPAAKIAGTENTYSTYVCLYTAEAE